jgi:hypothetical protein
MPEAIGFFLKEKLILMFLRLNFRFCSNKLWTGSRDNFINYFVFNFSFWKGKKGLLQG